jgi:hypothetical protein
MKQLSHENTELEVCDCCRLKIMRQAIRFADADAAAPVA